MIATEPLPERLSPSAADPPPTPSIADGVLRSLDPRALALDRTIGWIVTGVIAASLFFPMVIVLFVAPLPVWAKALLPVLWAAAMAPIAWFFHHWPEVEHRHAAYRVDLQGIEIRKGVVWRRVIDVPRSRVQHTDVSQGPIERALGLGTLVVYTAGTDHAKVDLHGLDHATALRIRDHLLPRELPREDGDAV